jgi:hypothetical protein
MPVPMKWILIGGVTLLCAGAAYLTVARGPALLLDLSSALYGCF